MYSLVKPPICHPVCLILPNCITDFALNLCKVHILQEVTKQRIVGSIGKDFKLWLLGNESVKQLSKSLPGTKDRCILQQHKALG